MKGRVTFALIASALMVFGGYAALYIAPDEKTMHAIQRIFYFHVPNGICSFIAFFIVFIANFAYLATRRPKWDWLGVAGAEVGVACSTIVLITGPIWAHPVWGIWWTWDARLTSTFVLWLLYVSYLLLRTLIEEPERRALLSSLFGIFAFLDVPLVFGAIRWWRTQHPSPVIMGGPGSGLEHTMKMVLFFSAFAMHVLALFLIVERYVLEEMKNDVDILQREAEAL